MLQAIPDRVTAEAGGKAHMGLMPPPPQVYVITNTRAYSVVVGLIERDSACFLEEYDLQES